MEFLNIGAGEVLVIVLLALVLFGPEDILRIMRTIGKYTRGLQRMWSQVSGSLREEYLPEEVTEAVQETQATLAEASLALKEASTLVQEVTSSADQELRETVGELEKDTAQAVSTLQAQAASASGTQADSPMPPDSSAPADAPAPEEQPEPLDPEMIAALLAEETQQPTAIAAPQSEPDEGSPDDH